MTNWWRAVKPYVHPDPDERSPKDTGAANIRPAVYGSIIFYAIVALIFIILNHA